MLNLNETTLNADIAFEEWRSNDRLVYKFNFDGSAQPLIGEVNCARDVELSFERRDHFLLYLLSWENFCPNEAVIEPTVLLNMSTTNSGHSLSELISFINFYLDNNLDMNVAVPSSICEKLPHIYGILRNVIPMHRIKVLEATGVFAFKELYVRRNTHFNSVLNWQDINYTVIDDILLFSDLHGLQHIDSPGWLLNLCEEIYENNREKYEIYDTIMLAKLSTDESMTTPGRALMLGSDKRERLTSAGVRILSLQDFESTEHYITVLHGARTLVTSYGNVACTNRFFLNKYAEVVLLANCQYQWEYNHPGATGTPSRWHLRHSHLFPVARQTVIIDHNDEFQDRDVERIISLI
ncbi:hypothetical protein C8J38_1305 [Rhizobium sp. PP-WC-2G-219]|nr:hypothetical protein C8J38_1305 [Rhizobium sp. PP-WC-2G-219]